MRTLLSKEANRLENIINPESQKNQKIETFFEILQEILIEAQVEFETPNEKGVSFVSIFMKTFINLKLNVFQKFLEILV